MKKSIKLFVLTVFALTAITVLLSQTTTANQATKQQVYSNPAVKEAVDFLKDRLPSLIEIDRDRAIDEYMVHFDNLNKLDETDVLYLVGHFYSVVDDAKTAIPYFEMLINDPRLGEDARRMLNLLLYQRSVSYLTGDNKQASEAYLEDVLNLFPTGKYYPTYLFLWADLIAESERHAEVQSYISNYNESRNWIQNVFKPRKAQISNRINNLDLDTYYANPTDQEYMILETRINAIQKDLQTLYNEVKAVPGLIMKESLEQIYNEEVSLLNELKSSLKAYKDAPRIDLTALAGEQIPDSQIAYSEYREGALLLQQIKFTSDYYGKVIRIMDQIFEKRYELFAKGDPSIEGKDFSDMEMKRLFDIEQNLYIYTDIIKSIDEIMADPDYPSLGVDLRAEKQLYQEKYADLKNRKERYLAMRKHQSDAEEQVFNELLDEYYALSRDKLMLDETIPEVEDVMASLIMENYPQDMQEIIESKQVLAGNDASRTIILDENLNAVVTNIDFIQLQLDYRNLRYREQQRQANSANLSEAELVTQYNQIIAEKKALLKRHQDFVAANPEFQALEQPSGGYLVNTADLYYNMAELQYTVDLDNPQLALEYYRRTLELNPNFYLRDYALYNIAYISSELKKEELDARIAEFRDLNPNVSRPAEYRYKESDFQEALLAYNEITTSDKYNGSELYDESLYRLSVLNFIIGSDAEEPIKYYEAANRGFDYLVNKPGSKYAYEALYQRGWVNMNRGDAASVKLALTDFVNLLKAVDTNKIENKYLAEDYKNNAIDNIAYSLIALDGTDFVSESRGVTEMEIALADYKDEKVIGSILDKAAGFKTDMEAPLQAIDYMRLRIDKAPLALNNPTLVDSVLKLYHTPGITLRSGTDLATVRTSTYQYMIDNFNNNSAWYNANVKGKDPNTPEISRQLATIKNAYEEMRIRLYNIMVTSASDEAYDSYTKHMKGYSSYSELFGEDYTQWAMDTEKQETALIAILAEKNNTPRDYAIAINKLREYNDKYPSNTDYFNNEGLAYKFTQSMFDLLNAQYGEPGFAPTAGLPPNRESLFALYSNASLRFYDVLNMPEYTSDTNRAAAAQILFSLADVEQKQGLTSQARSRYLKLIEDEELFDDTTKRSIYLNLAAIAERESNYADAEKWYRNALLYAQNDQDRVEINDQIKLQIQNNYEFAEQRGDYATVAREFLRLADEHKGEPNKYTGYRYQAADAYQKAKMYQESIDLRLDVARSKTTVEEVYFLYYESWTIADSLMQNPTLAKQLKNDFIALYPASNRTFNLRVQEIEAKKVIPDQREAAAQMYLALHNEVKANQIDSGNVTAEDVYLWAVDMYRADNNKEKTIELLTEFIDSYPGNPQTVTFMTVIADEYLAQGDSLKFEQYAREIYLKDKTKPERYLTIANRKLGKIAFDFDSAYLNKDWTLAFAKRDEFKRVEAEYEREGLEMQNTLAYEAFDRAEKEYEELQAKLAYLRNFDQQLQAVENGSFLRSSPAQLITVNANTTWQRHLFGGTPNRIPGLKNTAETEYNKIIRLLDQPAAINLDNPRRLRALNLICRINEHAANAIKTQVNRYIEIANEMAPFKNRSQYSQEQYDELLNTQLLPYSEQFANEYITYAYSIHMQIYTNYILAGYSDNYTKATLDKLNEWNVMPEFSSTSYPLDSSWTIGTFVPGGVSKNVTSGITTTTSPNGQKLSSFTIPAQHTLTLERGVNTKIVPDHLFMHMVYPYDPEFFVNGQKVDLIYVPVDTLIAGKAISTHYAIRIPTENWKQGGNVVKGVFPNDATEAVPFHFNLVAHYSAQRLADTIPPVTMKMNSDATWRVMKVNPETSEEVATYATLAQDFNLPIDNTDKLVNTAAKAIWTNEPAEPEPQVTFEVSFNIDTIYREGYIDFVAPESASFYLNGAVLDEDYPMDYDADPFLVYPNRVNIPKDLVKKGANTLRIVVQNQSPYRGMIAEITIVKAGKE